MRQLRALLWKEWREDHVYLWIGLGVLLILPLINAWQEIYYLRHFELHSSEWIFFLGGLFAVVVSVAVSCRDLRPSLEDFWRSRPVSVGRWMLAKYAAGLCIVQFCCIFPVVVEMLLSKKTAAAPFVVWLPFLWIAIFSLAFLIGCLLRKSAQTSLLAIGAMLLLYFLPVLIPPLRWLNVDVILVSPKLDSFGNLTNFDKLHPWAYLWTTPPLYFALGMLTLATVCMLLALVAVTRDWQISVGRRTMFGSIATAFLLLLFTAAFQLGTNMPVLQSVTLPGDEYGYELSRFPGKDEALLSSHDAYRGEYRRVSISPDGQLALSQPLDTNTVIHTYFVPSPVNPDIRYQTSDAFDEEGRQVVHYTLRILDISNGAERDLVLRDPMVDAKGNRTTWQGPCHIFGNRLYIPGDQLVVLDISSPLSPKIISKSPYGFGLHGPASGSGGPVLEYAIEPVPGLTNEQQFELAGPPGYGYENGLLLQESQISSRENALELYKLDVLASTRARFVRIAERKPTPMESLFHADHYSTLFLKGGKIYALNRDTSALNPIINIYSATGPHPLERIGHFGAISITGICPLSDGRCIVVGGTYEYQRSNKLWLLGPPPAH